MKLRKKVKRTLLVLILLLIIAVVGIILYKNLTNKAEVKEVKIVNEIKKYGYKLKDTKTQKYKDVEIVISSKKIYKNYETYEITIKNYTDKTILVSDGKSSKNICLVDQILYVRKISEMFIYDFYSLEDKTAKTDIGGVDFVYSEIADNFLQNAQDTYYKYVESNIYNNRNQSLPVVSEITIESVEQEEYAYGEKNDSEAYKVTVSWNYTDDSFTDYQKEAELIFIHDDIKLCLVELQ